MKYRTCLTYGSRITFINMPIKWIKQKTIVTIVIICLKGNTYFKFSLVVKQTASKINAIYWLPVPKPQVYGSLLQINCSIFMSMLKV